MARLSMTGGGDVHAIADLLSKEIQNSGMSCELVDRITRSDGVYTICIMVFEKYYWRASNRASLTVVVSGAEGQISVDSIGSGGGQGPVFKMSWGAEEDFVATVEKILNQQGFRS